MYETRELEFKEIVSSNYLKVVCAFANYGTGKIIFGITDSGVDKGIAKIEQEKLNIENCINDNIKPVPRFSLDSDNGKIILTVYKGISTPYCYKGKAYKRSDTSSLAVDDAEFKRLVMEGLNIRFEQLPSQKKSLNFNYLENLMREKFGITNLNKDVLKTLQLYNDENGYNMAAFLFSDTEDSSVIDIVKFGSDIDIIERRIQLSNKSIIEQYNETEKIFKEYYIVEKIQGSLRSQFELIPLVAFREALANAVVHRKWDINANIQISMYHDRIEIVSPGGLPSDISEAEYLDGRFSSLRNPIIADIFFRLGIIEKFGTGVKRIKQAYDYSPVAPVFKIYDNSITVILPVLQSVSYTDDEQFLLNFISEEPASSSTLIDLTGFEKTKLLRLIRSLINKRAVILMGQGRSVKYKLRK